MSFKIEVKGNYLEVFNTHLNTRSYRGLLSSTIGSVENNKVRIHDKETTSDAIDFPLNEAVDKDNIPFDEIILLNFFNSTTGADSASTAEIEKLTSNNTPSQINLEASSLTFSGVKSISFTVYDGTVDITVAGEATITYPLTGDVATIKGVELVLDYASEKDITVDATNGKALVTIIT